MGGALVKAGVPFKLPEGLKPSRDMKPFGDAGVAEKSAKPAKQKSPDTLSELAEATKADPVP